MGKNNKFSLTTKSHSSTRVNPYDKITLSALNVSCPDKQIVLPRLDNNGVQQACIELYSLFIFIIALGTQYLNLYRSVWWHSKTTSRNTQPINYHLIDLDVSQFSLLFIGQSSLISILRALLGSATVPTTLKLLAQTSAPTNSTTAAAKASTTNSTNNNNSNYNNGNSTSLTSSSYTVAGIITSSETQQSNNSNSNNNKHQNQNQNWHQNSQQSNTSSQHQPQQNQAPSRSSLTTIVTTSVSWICNYYLFRCGLRIWNNFGLNGISCISYPIVSSINQFYKYSIFAPTLNLTNQLYHLTQVVSIFLNSADIIQVVESYRKTKKLNLSFLTLSITLFSSHIKFDDDKLCHTCSNQPDEIRDEVEKLKTIFNERLKFVLIKSILLAYYASFVPICFAQNFLYYDYTWTAQHVILTWFSSLIMLISSSYTPHFYDTLHRSAFHFGKWQRLEARNTLMPCINWSENMIYPQGEF